MNITANADLRGLVQKWPLDRHPDPHTDAWTLGYLRAKRECAEELEAALSVAQGQGFVMVPREPTVSMFAAMIRWAQEEGDQPPSVEFLTENMPDFAKGYTAMLAAAPAQPDGVSK